LAVAEMLYMNLTVTNHPFVSTTISLSTNGADTLSSELDNLAADFLRLTATDLLEGCSNASGQQSLQSIT
jgi:hypothetical protein